MSALKGLFALIGWAAALPLAALAVFGTVQDIWLAVDSFAAVFGIALLAAVAWAVCDIAANVRRLTDGSSPRNSRAATGVSPSDRIDAAQRHKDAIDDAAERALENLRRNRQARSKAPPT